MIQTKAAKAFAGAEKYYHSPLLCLASYSHTHNREIYSHVYSKRQTSESSWEFLKIKNVRLKTVQNNCYRHN